MPETQWMTLLETADMMKRLPIQVTRMCEDGKLEYYVEDGRYFVSRESIDLFMDPRTDGPLPSNRDTNGTPRRQYGRAPDDLEPSSEPVIESETVDGRDEAADAGEEETVNGRDAADAAGEEETGSIVEEASGADDENAEAREDAATPESANTSVDVEAQEERGDTGGRGGTGGRRGDSGGRGSAGRRGNAGDRERARGRGDTGSGGPHDESR